MSLNDPPPPPSWRSRSEAILWCLFTGGLGGHKFYLRQPGWGACYLMFCWTFVPACIAFIELIILLCSSEASFNAAYNSAHGIDLTRVALERESRGGNALIVGGAVFGFFILVTWIGKQAAIPPPTTSHGATAEAETARVPEKPAPAPVIEKWHQVGKWHGNGSLNTETLHIPSDDWVIQWDTRNGEYGSGTFSITVKRADGEQVALAANLMGKDNNESHMHQAGDYYLEVGATQPWAIQVQARY